MKKEEKAQVAGTSLKPANDVSSTNPVKGSSFGSLREKIESNLKKSENAAQKKKAPKSSKQPSESLKKQDASLDVRGKKRDRNGDVKDTAAQSAQGSSEKTTHQDGKKPTDLMAILAELGGTEEDLDLINGAESDSEMEGAEATSITPVQTAAKKGKSLESGMANILKEIALVRDTYTDSESETEKKNKVNGSAQPVRPVADKPEENSIKFKSAAQELQSKKTKKSPLICVPRPDWFNIGSVTPQDEPKKPSKVQAQSIEHLHEYGKKLLQQDNETFKGAHSSSSSQAFYSTVIASGTLSDKISALTLAVQESPLHNMQALENLINLAKKRGRSQAIDVLRALKDLFAQGSLLPGDRRLYIFSAHPQILSALSKTNKPWKQGDLLPSTLTEAQLTVLSFEDWLKEQYFEIIKVLETWCNDEIEFAKSRATSYVYELLKEKPEEEANLLRLLINKLGDPVKKIASQASYLIMQLLANHPAMKEVVVSALETDFIFKPNQSTHARYYAAVTLNQTALSANEEGIANKLLDICFGLFKILLKSHQESKPSTEQIPRSHQRQRKQAASAPGVDQEDELREKLTSAVLTGVNRAYPYAGADHQNFNEHLDTLFQITHSANFNTSIQAMLLIQQLISNTATSSDRFYRTLYESLLDPRLTTSSKQQLYLNLLHRSLKADLNQKRVKAFAKRILQILSLQDPSFICGAFFLLKDIEKTFPSLAAMLDQAEDHEGDEEVFRDVDADLQDNAAQHRGNSDQNATYDASKRDPAYANAESSCLWDVLPYLSHFHPSVSISADHMLDHKSIPGKPDLNLHTLIHFLDRFVYKNAKASSSEKMRGSSIMQPMANEDTRAVLLTSGNRAGNLPVNSAEFLRKKQDQIAADDVFFHQYFTTLGKSATRKVNKARKAEKEDESDAEGEIWQAMLKNGPDLEGLGEDEDEDVSDMEGFAEAMDDDDDDDVDMDNVDSDNEMQPADEDDDGSVDIEAGIFDDSDEAQESDEVSSQEDAEDVEFDGLSSAEESETKKHPSKKTLQKRESREQKRKLKALPVFASAADWAKELDNDEDEDLG